MIMGTLASWATGATGRLRHGSRRHRACWVDPGWRAAVLGLTRLPRAQVMVTTNGGTLWRNVPVIYSQTALFAAYSVSQQAGAALMGSYQPGTLLSVMADPSGRYVWAVGAQPWAVAVPSPG